MNKETSSQSGDVTYGDQASGNTAIAGGVHGNVTIHQHGHSLPNNESEASLGTRKTESRWAEIRKIVVGAVLALLLSASFIGAAIPRYELQIKSPAFKKDGIYEVPAGTVIIKWAILKKQWLREVDVNDIKANITIRRVGDGKKESIQNLLGEMKAHLQAGKYEIQIDAYEHHRSETIALQVAAQSVSTNDTGSYLRGSVENKSGKPMAGAEIEVTDILGQPVLKTTTTNDGGFYIGPIPAIFGERARVIVRMNGMERYNQYWTLPGPAKIRLDK